jgi:DNA polymerase (family 10)
MDWFTGQKNVIEVLGKGKMKSSVEFDSGIRAQLWVHPPAKFGTALQYATGSKDHNVRLREIAQSQGMSLSDQSILMPDGSERFIPTEAEVYSTLGLPFVPPELREDRGEIQISKGEGLPILITRKDILSDLHTHSEWSDGRFSIREMVEGAIQRGLKVVAVTDHSQSLGIANGLSPERLRQQRLEIDEIQSEYEGKITILQGSEVEIKADGSLDFSDDVLASLDIVVASLHTSLTQPRDQVTQRLLNAITNPHVDIIGHPTGRMIPDREGADLDMDAILNAALKHDVVLEINANPQRLDLNDIYARRVIDIGGKLAINTDAHWMDQFDLVDYGIATARRAWVEARHVINTWDANDLLSWLRSRG